MLLCHWQYYVLDHNVIITICFSISFLVKKVCVKNRYLQHQMAEVLFNLKRSLLTKILVFNITAPMGFIRKVGWFYSL